MSADAVKLSRGLYRIDGLLYSTWFATRDEASHRAGWRLAPSIDGRTAWEHAEVRLPRLRDCERHVERVDAGELPVVAVFHAYSPPKPSRPWGVTVRRGHYLEYHWCKDQSEAHELKQRLLWSRQDGRTER